jgi:hypothetical protein
VISWPLWRTAMIGDKDIDSLFGAQLARIGNAELRAKVV